MENLTERQKDVIRKSVGSTKFVDIAVEAGCTAADVRKFASVVFADRKAKQEAEQAGRDAKKAAEVAIFNTKVDELFESGDMVAMRQLWEAENYDDIATDVITRNWEVESEVQYDFIEAHEDEIEELVRQALSVEIKEALDEAFDEFVAELREFADVA